MLASLTTRLAAYFREYPSDPGSSTSSRDTLSTVGRRHSPTGSYGSLSGGTRITAIYTSGVTSSLRFGTQRSASGSSTSTSQKRRANAKGKERTDYVRNSDTRQACGPSVDIDGSDDERARRSKPAPEGPVESRPPRRTMKSAICRPRAQAGEWIITEDKPMTILERGPLIARGDCCDVYLCYGLPSGWTRPVWYIQKTWRPDVNKMKEGFYIELSMYQSLTYLALLQRNLVPRVAGLTISSYGVSMAMELIDDCFWFEAHAGLPEVLKSRIIHAFIRLHARGVVHANPELRHILITSRCEVKLIDFKWSESLSGEPNLDIARCGRRSFAQELRQLKYKLDFRGARAIENAKMARYHEIRRRNRVQARVPEDHATEADAVPVDDHEFSAAEEVCDIPATPSAFEKLWQRDLYHAPRTIWVPRLSEEEAKNAWLRYHDTLAALDADYRDRGLQCEPPSRIASAAPTPHLEYGAPTMTRSKKRRANTSSELEPPAKRARGDALDDGTYWEGINTHPLFATYQFPVAPVPAHVYENGKYPSQSGPPPSYERSSRSYDCAPGNLLQASRGDVNAKGSAKVDLKVRDFAGVACEPRGYYVPHPPTENRASIQRTWYIRHTNAMECRQLEYPYYDGDANEILPPYFIRSMGSGKICKGTLMRISMDPEGKDSRSNGKRRRLLDGVADPLDGKPEFFTVDSLQLRGPIDRGRRDAAGSILKEVPRVWPLREDGDDSMSESQLLYSPKLGPHPLYVSPLDPMPILGAVLEEKVPIKDSRALVAFEDAFLDALIHEEPLPPPLGTYVGEPSTQPAVAEGMENPRPGEQARRKRLVQLSGAVAEIAKRAGTTLEELCVKRFGDITGAPTANTTSTPHEIRPVSQQEGSASQKVDPPTIIDLTGDDSDDDEDAKDAAIVEAMLVRNDGGRTMRRKVGRHDTLDLKDIIQYFH